MENKYPGGYSGKMLNIDLTARSMSINQMDLETINGYIGGVGIGIKLLYERVLPGIKWNDPQNCIIITNGPLSGTRVAGSGTFCVVTKGPMTNMAISTQANGFMGAFLKLSGFDGINISGCASKWCYLFVHDDTAELRDADHLVGKDTWETEDLIRQELKNDSISVYGIGPAGENLVRFACIVGDNGHVAAHGGVGAVMGSKKIKAIAVARSKGNLHVKDPEKLKSISKTLFEISKARTVLGKLPIGGTSANVEETYKQGALPIKNYTTNIFPEYTNYIGMSIRSQFPIKNKPCWACGMNHCGYVTITEGPFKGFVGEEPEYEQFAAFGPIIGQPDPGSAIYLANLGDRLGLDTNESGWLIGWVMECYEKGILTSKDTDGLKMTWGNVEATIALLKKIATREGFGNILAEGVKHAAEHIGGEALNCAIYTKKGASPRSHDHRSFWNEMFDTCTSNTGTIEVWGGRPQPDQIGLPPKKNAQNPWEVSSMNAWLNGRRQFEDCLGICRFCAEDFQLTIDAINAVTGWSLDKQKAMEIGLKIINHMRVFNIRHGLTKELEYPSPRYGSAPVDGPLAGISIMPYWDFMLRNYYSLMGWDKETGKPLPETLRKLGLESLVKDLK